jgi:hypothetical protein
MIEKKKQRKLSKLALAQSLVAVQSRSQFHPKEPFAALIPFGIQAKKIFSQTQFNAYIKKIVLY